MITRRVGLGLGWGAGLAVATACGGHGASEAGAVALHVARSSACDLAVTGQLAGLPAGETRFVRWSDVRALPTVRLELTGEFVAGEQQVTAVFLADLVRALPLTAEADIVLATCEDGYASIYRVADFPAIRPFVVLEINGEGPEHWPPAGLKFNPGPYVISVAASVAPAVAQLLDANHKRPWSVSKLEFANYAGRFRDAHSDKWSALSPRAQRGREIWINSCLSCHRGPGATFGGTKSDRPFEVIFAHAAFNADYFRRYVRDPKGVIAGAKMEAHVHYTDDQLDALIAFITAEQE